MFKIYLRSALRQLSRSRLYAIINVAGLATGITVMLMAILFWRDEESFDKFHANVDNLYRVTTTMREYKEQQAVTVGGTGQVQGPAFKQNIPELESFARVFGGDIYSNVVANRKTIKVLPLFVEDNFLQVFSFPVVAGDASSALKRAEDVVVTESTAKKFFNTTDVVGRLLEVDADPSFEKLGKPLVITAVVKDPPANSSLQFDLLYSFPFFRLSFDDDAWLNAYLSTFVLLRPDASIKAVESKMMQVYDLRSQEQLTKFKSSIGYDPEISYHLQHITDIHLNPLDRPSGNREAGIINGSDKSYSIVFLVISGFILLMAAINFVNINIAGAIKRSKEVGVRKIAGGSKLQIILQFLIEASICCLVAFVVSCVLLYSLLPLFNELTSKQLVAANILSADVILYFFVLLVLLIVITSVYPSVILSRFRPAEVLYNRVTKGGSGFLRKVLVIAQFTPAIFLLIATIVYYGQMRYLRTKELGYNPSNVITTGIYGDRDYKSAVTFMKNELSKETDFKMISFGGEGYTSRYEFNGKSFEFFQRSADENYLPMFEIPLLAGRNFIASDADNGVIVNESFLRAANIEFSPGVLIDINNYDQKYSRRIVGVVRDYHHSSLRQRILPMVMFMKKNPEGAVWVKVDKPKMQQAIQKLGAIYKAAMPSALFEYQVLEEANANDFARDRRWQKAVTIGTVLSFVICWLGLFGLAHLSTYQRVKEIGIRKVLGASVSQIVMLLTGQFVKLVLIAIIIASPLAWLAMSSWLNAYAYHINIGAGVFVVASSMAVAVTFLSVSFQSFRSALTNPVKSLRTE